MGGEDYWPRYGIEKISIGNIFECQRIYRPGSVIFLNNIV